MSALFRNLFILILCYPLQIFSLEWELGFIKNVKEDSSVTYLQPDEIYHSSPNVHDLGFFKSKLQIYCYRGQKKSLSRIFQTVFLNLDIKSDDFTQYEGETPEIVKERYEKQTSIFNYILSNKKTQLKLNPFNQSCIGIDTAEDYLIKLRVIRADFWKIILISIGLTIFLYAVNLSHNSLFYYLSGISLGVFASSLLIIYFGSKLIPRRPMMYSVVICGWSLAIYFFQVLWDNIQLILVNYRTHVFWYVIITGFISFIICYRLGPPQNQRSLDLIKWGLQLFSLVLIYNSSDYQEASFAIIILTIFIYYFPRSWLYKFRGYYVRFFPPKPRLLTNEEYYEQGVRETTKALEELREYASSPECKQWRMISKLKDPLRFASFVEGSSHISDQEILEYETSRADITDSELSEDENEDNGCEQNNVRGETIGDIRRRLQLQRNYGDDDNEISEDEEYDNNRNNSRNRSGRGRHIISSPANGVIPGHNNERMYPNYNNQAMATTSTAAVTNMNNRIINRRILK